MTENQNSTAATSVIAKAKDPNFFIWTIQIPQWRKHKRDGLKFLDITVKSGIRAFAPHWYDLKDYKAGQMSEDDYTQRYHEKMEESLYEHRPVWDRLSVYPYMVLGCYCPEGAFCHRHMFKHLAKAHLETMGWTVELRGEWHGDETNLVIPEQFVNAYPAK